MNTPSKNTDSQPNRREFGLLALAAALTACGPSNSQSQSPSTSTPQPNPLPNPGVITVPTAPNLQLPMIFGFSQPIDVFNPSVDIQSLIVEQLRRGVTEVPIYLGGNVTPDGTKLGLTTLPSNQGGPVTEPDLSNFMNLLNIIEQQGGLPTGTIRLRGYVRASVTQADANNDLFGPGRFNLTNATSRQNLKTLLGELINGKYNLNGGRIDEITLDLEALTSNDYDPNDLTAGDDLGVNTLASFIAELKNSNFPKKIGAFCAGLLNRNWFPNENDTPGSPFTVSPQNFISADDAEILFQAGLDVLEIGAYNTFPMLNGPGGFADPNTYGPIHVDFESFVRYQISELQRIAANNPGLNLTPENNLRLDIPVFQGAEVVPTNEAISALQTLIAQGVVAVIKGATFDFGALDNAERTALLTAQQ